jgi:DNA-binding transcriptional LysR family regulator
MARSIGGRALAGFLARRPDVQVFFDVGRTEWVVEMIESGFADLGMAVAPSPRPGIRIEKLTSGPMVVVLPHGHRLERRAALTPGDLKDERLVGIETSARLGGMVRHAFDSSGTPYRPMIEVRHGATACMLVEQGLGLAVVDPFSARAEPGWHIATRPFLPEIELPGCVIHLEGRPLSRLAAEFLAELRAVAGAEASAGVEAGAGAEVVAGAGAIAGVEASAGAGAIAGASAGAASGPPPSQAAAPARGRLPRRRGAPQARPPSASSCRA